jgi:hypothetical protein
MGEIPDVLKNEFLTILGIHVTHISVYMAMHAYKNNHKTWRHLLFIHEVLNGEVDRINDIDYPQCSCWVHCPGEHGEGSVVLHEPPRGTDADLDGGVWGSGAQHHWLVVVGGRRGTDQHLGENECVCGRGGEEKGGGERERV